MTCDTFERPYLGLSELQLMISKMDNCVTQRKEVVIVQTKIPKQKGCIPESYCYFS